MRDLILQLSKSSIYSTKPQLDDNDYTKAAGVATDDQAAVGIVYQF
ncbi:hypothetical protein G3W08_16845 [Klebsiella pneumoniae]|nr:hypothetical protein [Klebsiella pneumoniae]